MSDELMPQDQPGNADPSGAFTQHFSHAPVAARVPERIGKGVFVTGVLVQDGPSEFVLDFLQALGRPPAIAARVILPPGAMLSFVNGLRDQLAQYTRMYGAPAALPRPNNQRRPSIQELYEHFKLPEEMLSGVYANASIIAFSAAEFLLDFVTGFYPTASVSCRTYFSAQQIPRVLETLGMSLLQHQRRFGPIQVQPPASPPSATPPSAEPLG